MDEPKISIIMPVYNAEKSLEKSINSVLNQCYKNLELIIIDDGSTDSSRIIIENYSKKDNRVVSFFNSNHGVSYTRNFGIKKATGEYIGFIDADDLYHIDFLKLMVKEIKNNDAELICCNFLMGYNESNFISKMITNYNVINFSEIYGIKAFEKACDLGIGISIWNKLIKKSLIIKNNILFNEDMTYGEDMFFCWKLFLVVKKIIYLKAELYFYRIERNNATSRYHKNLYENYILAYQEIRIFAEDRLLYNNYLNEYISVSFAQRLPSMLKMIIRKPVKVRDKLQSIKIILNNPDISWALDNKIDKLTSKKNNLYFLSQRKKFILLTILMYLKEYKSKFAKIIKSRL